MISSNDLGSHNNLPNRHILLKKIESDKGVVVNFGDYPSGAIENLTTYHEFIDKDLNKLTECLFRLITYINSWIDVTNGELIVDFVKDFRVNKKDGDRL